MMHQVHLWDWFFVCLFALFCYCDCFICVCFCVGFCLLDCFFLFCFGFFRDFSPDVLQILWAGWWINFIIHRESRFAFWFFFPHFLYFLKEKYVFWGVDFALQCLAVLSLHGRRMYPSIAQGWNANKQVLLEYHTLTHAFFVIFQSAAPFVNAIYKISPLISVGNHTQTSALASVWNQRMWKAVTHFY